MTWKVGACFFILGSLVWGGGALGGNSRVALAGMAIFFLAFLPFWLGGRKAKQ